MQSCSVCRSGPFTKQHFEEHELSKKHLKNLAVQQKKASSLSYVCAVCTGSSFDSKQNYERHCLSQKHLKAMAAQEGTTVETSSKKQRLLKAGEEVENHVKEVLPEERPFACNEPDCDYVSTRKGNLARHKRTHMGERLFKCIVPGCSFAASQSSTLAKHKRTH